MGIQKNAVEGSHTTNHKLTGNLKKAMKLTHKEVRERFRKTLVDIIFGHNNQLNNQSQNQSDSLIGEIELTKYNYYITHGVETEDVAPLEDHWLGNMFSLVDNSLKHHEALVEDLSNEVRDDYLLSVKKAIVDFTLKLEDDSRDKLLNLKNYEDNTSSGKDKVSASDLAKEKIFYKLKSELEKQLSVVPKPWKQSFIDVQRYLNKRLFTINPTVAQILSLWHTNFTGLRLIDV